MNYIASNILCSYTRLIIYITDVAELSWALDIKLSNWCCNVGEEKKLSAQKFKFKLNFQTYIIYSKNCLSRTPLGLKNLYSLDKFLVYTGSNYIDI